MKLNCFYNDDCLNIYQKLADSSLDLIIADPPYFQVCGDFDFGTFSSREAYLQWCRQWLLESKRVLKNNGTLILWGGVGEKEINIARLAIMIEDEKIFLRKNWITQRNVRGYGTKRNYMSAREDFLFLTKSDQYTFNVPYLEEKSLRKDLGFDGKPRKNTHKRVSNVWCDVTEASQSSLERCWHPTVKAQKLCDRLILTHSNPKDIIFIPFMGAGSEVISAIRHQRQYIAVEIDLNHYQKALKRITDLTKGK